MNKICLLFYLALCSVVFAQWELKVDGMHDWNRANPLSFGIDGSIGIWVNADSFPPVSSPISISTDSGDNWIQRQTPEFRAGTDLCVYNKEKIWFCTGDGKIYHSSDGGSHWVLQYEDLTNQSFFDFVKFFDELNGVVIGDAAFNSGEPAPVFKTTDGGNNWLNVNDSSLINEYSRDQFHTFSFPSVDVGYFYGSANDHLYKTIDGGSNWEIVPLPVEVTDIFMLKFYDEEIGMFVADNGPDTDYIYRTIDGGENWQKLNLESNTVHHDIEFLPGKPDSVWFTDYDHIYFSANMGDTWQEVDLGVEDLEARNIEFFDDQIGAILCDHNKFFYTSNNGGVVVSVEDDENLVQDYKLLQNYPNPFNPTTSIEYQVASSEMVSLIVYDILGREVRTLVNEQKSPGNYSVTFDAPNLSSGIYFLRMTSQDFIDVKKIMLIK